MNRSTIASFALTTAMLFSGCGDDDTTTCAPGESVACVGPGGCSGGQMCLPDGSGFGACDCGSPDLGLTDMGNDSGAAMDDAGMDDAGEASDGGGEVDGGPVECDPIAGTGCGTDEKCTFILDASGSDGETRCVADGAVAAGGDCVRDSGGDDCEGGTFCSDGVCEAICDLTDDGCADGKRCVELIPLFDDRENAGICQFVCDPLAQDCPNASDACYLSARADDSSFCAPPAAELSAEGAACEFTNGCAPGHGCVVVNETGTSLTCAYFCDPTGGGGPACDDAEGPGAGHGCISLADFYTDPVNDVAAATGVCVDCSRLPAGMFGCPS